MADQVIWGRVFNGLEKALDIAHVRHRLIAGNLSNSETPDYSPKEIDFQHALRNALGPAEPLRLVRTDEGHLAGRPGDPAGAEVFEKKEAWNGFNWMDADLEMTKLIENNLRFRTVTETLLRKVAIWREVIKEGGR